MPMPPVANTNIVGANTSCINNIPEVTNHSPQSNFSNNYMAGTNSSESMLSTTTNNHPHTSQNDIVQSPYAIVSEFQRTADYHMNNAEILVQKVVENANQVYQWTVHNIVDHMEFQKATSSESKAYYHQQMFASEDRMRFFTSNLNKNRDALKEQFDLSNYYAAEARQVFEAEAAPIRSSNIGAQQTFSE
ncbi:hypothetical protein ACVBEF_17675 [Glaciimonas sp. GG7]